MSIGELPQGWVETTLGSAVDYGKTTKAEPQDIKPDTWVLELEDVEKDSSKILQKLYFSERQSKSSKNRFNKGDVLYGKLRPYLSKIVMANDDGVCTTEIVPLSGGEFVDNKYLFYWLKGSVFKDYVEAVSYGVNMPRLGTKDGLDAPFIFMSLAEQQQIAAKLDELLAQVNSLKTRLDAIPNILKRFRQSVLAAAVSGKLTEDWRGDAQAPQTLDEIQAYWEWSYGKTSKKFKRPEVNQFNENDFDELPLSWVATKIGHVFDVYVGATPSRQNLSYWNGSVNWVSSSEVSFCRIRDTKESITQEGLAATSTNIHPIGTVMLAMIGQGKTRGQVAILDIEACHNQNTAALRVPTKHVVSDFLYFYLVEQYEETRRIGSGNNQQALNKSTVQALPFPLPPIEEQSEIVSRIHKLFTFADQIELRVRDAQSRVNHLTQSILAKAFRGELTAEWREQNPDLISGDNSAEALLARIQAERKENLKNKSNSKKTGQ